MCARVCVGCVWVWGVCGCGGCVCVCAGVWVHMCAGVDMWVGAHAQARRCGKCTSHPQGSRNSACKARQ